MYTTDENEEKEKEKEIKPQNNIMRQSKVLELFNIEKVQKFGDLSHNTSFDLENYESSKNDIDDFNANESFDVGHMNNLESGNITNDINNHIGEEKYYYRQILDENDKIQKKTIL
jgi:hypothetical protein